MRASNRTLRLHGAKDFRFHNEAVPQPRPGEVLLEIRSVGVCRSDLDYYNDGRIGDTRIESPHVLGHEFSARIIALGPDVDPALEGRRVAVEPGVFCGQCQWCRTGDVNLCPHIEFHGTPPFDGALRQYMTHPAEFVIPLPESISDDAGALLEPLAIGVHVLDLARPVLETPAAVVGCGPVGLSILQAARAAGMAPIYVFDRLQWRLDLALELGAAAAIHVDRQNPVEALCDLTRGRMVEYVFEAAGTDDSPALSAELASQAGKVFVVGIPVGDRVMFSAGTSRRKGLTVYVVRRSRATLKRAIALLARGEFEAERLITHRFPFAEAERAYIVANNYEDGVVKAVVRVQE